MDRLTIAAFSLGPFDGKRLLLPCDPEDPWPRFVIPQFGSIQVEVYYLRSGRLDDELWAYLYDDSWAGLVG